jgi:hypothetical protein
MYIYCLFLYRPPIISPSLSDMLTSVLTVVMKPVPASVHFSCGIHGCLILLSVFFIFYIVLNGKIHCSNLIGSLMYCPVKFVFFTLS